MIILLKTSFFVTICITLLWFGLAKISYDCYTLTNASSKDLSFVPLGIKDGKMKKLYWQLFPGIMKLNLEDYLRARESTEICYSFESSQPNAVLLKSTSGDMRVAEAEKLINSKFTIESWQKLKKPNSNHLSAIEYPDRNHRKKLIALGISIYCLPFLILLTIISLRAKNLRKH